MAALADAMDAVAELFQRSNVKMGSLDHAKIRTHVVLTYFAFGWFWLYVWGAVSYLMFSVMITAASCVQCLGFGILAVKVHGTKSVKGISSKMLEMFAVYLCSRLTSTCLKSGYIPMDATGDWVYQFCDLCSLVLVVHLLYCVHKKYAPTYDAEKDTFPIGSLVLPCFVLAWFVHGRHNKSFFFDTCWAFSTNLEALCIVPQLWMMTGKGGKVDSYLGHFVATVVLSGAFTCWFWFYNYQTLEMKGPTKAGKVLIGAHVLKVVLCGDFSYYYISALLKGTAVVLPNREGMINV
jgi:hypothetical protein